MVASSSNPVRFRAARWVSLLAIAACSSPNDFFEQPMGAGGSAAGSGGTPVASGGTAAVSGGGGMSAGSGGSSVGAGNGGNAGSGNSTGAGATGGSEPGTGGTSDGQGGDGGESGDLGAGGTGGASGSAGEGAAGTQGDAGRSGSAGSSAEGGTSSGGTSAGMSGGGGIGGFGGIGGVGAIGGIGGIGGASGGGGKGGGKGGCGSQPEVCDGENNNCTGGADEGNACPSGCEGATEEGRIYVFCSGSGYSGSWQMAESRCQGAIATAAGIAMKLAVIETEDENEFLAEWVEDRDPADGAWIGANDLDVENEWAWGTGSSRVPFYRDEGEGNNGEVIMSRYNDWGNGRPNGDTAMQDDEDCGHFDPVYNWRWNDRRCGDVLPAFVCEQSP